MPISSGPGSGSSSFVVASDLTTHAADTTSVHGITDTSVLLTTSSAALTYARHPALADNLPSPFYVAHRGAKTIYPEESWEGYRAAAAAGFPVEGDVLLLSDGTMVLSHDTTVDRTTDGTGNVVDKTRAEWNALRIDAALTGGGSNTGTPVIVEDWLDELGGHTLLIPEVKVTTARTPLITAITERGLHRSVIVQSFTYADVTAAADAGIAAMYISDAATPATLVADGIEFLGCSTAVSGAYVSAAVDAGLTVMVYNAETRAEVATELAKGVTGIICGDPWWIDEDRLHAVNTDPFAELVKWPGWTITGTATTPRFLPPRSLSMATGLDTFTSVRMTGWAGVRSTASGTLKIRGTVRFGTYTVNSSRWASIYVGTMTDTYAYQDGTWGATQVGYHCLIRRDGQTQIYRIDSGGATLLNGATGTVTAASGAEGETVFELEINATDITLRNFGAGVTATAADTTYRAAGQEIALNHTSNDVYFRDISVLSY